MGKDDKKNIGIKTARYFTKSCSNCNFEYPNWFTNCPKCGIAWDHASSDIISSSEGLIKKNIKIVVRITEEDFNETIDDVDLIFSADQGQSWYKVKMNLITDYYIAEITEIPTGSIIIYYIEVILKNGQKITEDNDQNYFYYTVGEPNGNKKTGKLKSRSNKIPNQKDYFDFQNKIIQNHQDIKSAEQSKKKIVKEEYSQPFGDSIKENQKETIFGIPQMKINSNLKICPHCNSKIKQMWSVCPICGKIL